VGPGAGDLAPHWPLRPGSCLHCWRIERARERRQRRAAKVEMALRCPSPPRLSGLRNSPFANTRAVAGIPPTRPPSASQGSAALPAAMKRVAHHATVGDGLGLDKTQLGWLTGLYLLPGIALALFMESSCGASVSDRASRATITRKDYAARILAPRRPRGCSWSGNRETLFPFSMRYAARSCPSRSSRSGRENRGTRSDSLWDS
jgi:hypothetical protein